jgi:hypothetical protein
MRHTGVEGMRSLLGLSSFRVRGLEGRARRVKPPKVSRWLADGRPAAHLAPTSGAKKTARDRSPLENAVAAIAQVADDPP